MMAESRGFKKSARKSEDVKNNRLTEYFHNLIKRRIDFSVTRDEIMDIISSADVLVETLVAKMTSKVGWLPFSRVIRVGSMAEGTSVGQPNEFDYLAVLNTEPSGVQVERICENRRGYAHVKITDPHLRSIWGKWMDGAYLKSDFTRGDTNVLSGYFDTLGNAFQEEVCNILNSDEERLICETSIGKMTSDQFFVLDVKKHGPAFTPTFSWKSKLRSEKLSISIDITPAIEIDLSPEVISDKDTFDPRFYKKVEGHGKCMLISCRNDASCESRQCFCLIFTETEVELVRGLSQHHKDCYKLLKFIFNSRHGYTFFPSYAWKTLVLKHNCHCKETENLAVCFKTLVASCLHYMFNRKTEEKIELSRIARIFMPGEKFVLNIPSVFFKEHNILDSKYYMFPCEQFLQEIEIMLQSIDDISCKEYTEDDDRNLKVVNSRSTGVEAYVSTLPLPKFLPFVKSNTELKNCLECYKHYFNENIL